MISPILLLKLLLFSVLLSYVAVKLPFNTSIRAIADLSRRSLQLLSNHELTDDESAIAMRKYAWYIFAETLKVFFYLCVIVAVAVAVWLLLNVDEPVSLQVFDVFYTVEGITYALAGVALFVGIQKVLRRG